MYWLEDIHVDDDVVEVSSLTSPHRDRERIGKVLSISQEYVLIETDDGQLIMWENGRLFRIPEETLH